MTFPVWFKDFAQQVDSYIPFACTFGRTTKMDQVAVYEKETDNICGTVTLRNNQRGEYVTLNLDYNGQQAEKTWYTTR